MSSDTNGITINSDIGGTRINSDIGGTRINSDICGTWINSNIGGTRAGRECQTRQGSDVFITRADNDLNAPSFVDRYKSR